MAYDASQNPLEITEDHQPASTAMVTIHIVDVNDHAPLIQEICEFVLPENKEPGFFIGRVTATDLDAGVNGEVTFEIVPEDLRTMLNAPQLEQVIGFRMTPNGSLFSTRHFDREIQVCQTTISGSCIQVSPEMKGLRCLFIKFIFILA